MKRKGYNKQVSHYIGNSERPKVELIADPSGSTSDEIWSIPIDADAIRNAGVRCETCEHWRRESKRRWNSHDPKDGYWDSEWFVCEKGIHQAQNKGSTSMSGGLHLHTHGPDFFCADHSALAEDKT